MKHTMLLCGVIGAVTLFLTACNQFVLPDQVRQRIYALELDADEEAFTVYAPAGLDKYIQPDPLKITVRNTGNQTLEDVGMVFNGPDKALFNFSVDSISQLRPGESASVEFIFPDEIQSPRCFDGDILVGNTFAAKKIRLTFSAFGYVDISSGNFSYTNPDIKFLQAGNDDNDQANLEISPRPDPAAPWFSSNPAVASIDESGRVQAHKGGTVIIGYIYDYYNNEVPWVRGRRVTVYPAPRELNPRYAVVNGVLQRENNVIVLPLNSAEIDAAKVEDAATSVEFTLDQSSGSILTLSDDQTGELTFSGSTGDTAQAAVTLALKKPVPGHVSGDADYADWQLLAFKGRTADFTARIGAPPPAEFTTARAVNQTGNPSLIDIIVEFTDAVSGNTNGFTFYKNGAALAGNNPTPAANSNIIVFTLQAGTIITAADALTVSYTGGGLTSNGDNVPAFDREVSNHVMNGPRLLSAEVIGTAPTALIATFDKAPQTADAAGFSVAVQGSPGSQLPGGRLTLALSGIDGVKMTLDMSRQPAWLEISETDAAKKLALVYDPYAGSLKDGEGYLAPGATAAITFTNFSEEQFKAPELKKAEIDAAVSPVTLTLTYDKTLADNSISYSGFTLNAAGLSANGGRPVKDVTNSSALVLTLNRSPSLAEAADLKLNYNMVSGIIADENGNKAASVSNFPVTVYNSSALGASPEVTAVTINAANPTILVVMFNKPIALTSIAGFSVAGSLSATSIIDFTLTGGDQTLNLTLNQKPSYDEVTSGNFTLSYSQMEGNVKDRDNSAIAAVGFDQRQITQTGFTAANDGRPIPLSVVINAGTGSVAEKREAAKIITVTFDKMVQITNINGFTISGSASAVLITTVSGSGTRWLSFTMNDWPSASEAGSFRLSYNMAIGNVKSSAGDNRLATFDEEVDFQNFEASMENTDNVPPKIVSVTVEDNAPSVLRVVFSEPVTVTANLFAVKVNYLPWKSLSSFTDDGSHNPALDIALAETRSISGAQPVGGSNNAVWDLTMPAPAKHGEILRLATTAAGAAKDSANNELPKVPQFIARNMVKRVREVYEYEPGLYYTHNVTDNNGITIRTTEKISTVTDGAGGEMYDKFIGWLRSGLSAGPNEGEVITLVLDGNQTLTDAPGSFPYNSYTSHTKLNGNKNGATFIITTVIGTVDDVVIYTRGRTPFQSRNGMAWIIEDHIVFDGTTTDGSNSSFIYIADAGKMVLDGGVIRGNTITTTGSDDPRGGIRVGGGTYGAYLIMNSGKITGNLSNGHTSYAQSASGGITIDQYGIVVMNGGEISGNETVGNSEGIRAGAIVSLTGTSRFVNKYHANASFFMTGGVIKGNKVSSTNGNIASAGGVLVSGTFQKVGGVIYGDDTGDPSLDNTTAMTGGNISVGAAAVLNTSGVNPAATAKRDSTASESVPLFVDSYKPADGTAGVNTIPAWAESFWD